MILRLTTGTKGPDFSPTKAFPDVIASVVGTMEADKYVKPFIDCGQDNTPPD